MQQLFPGHGEYALEQVYTVPELAFPAEGVPFLRGNQESRRPYIFYNMVSSVDGRATTAAGNAEGLGSDTDRQLMYRLRLAADCVLCGASTFRRDQFLPLVKPWLEEERARFFPDKPQPYGAVISRDGNLPLDKKFWQAGPDLRLVFLGSQATPEAEKRLAPYARIFRLEAGADGQPDPARMLAILYEALGVRRLLVEGGPALNYSLLSRGFGDELFWTLAPRLVVGTDNLSMVGGPGNGFPLDRLLNLRLVSIYRNGEELFMRYRLPS
jgi:2,5-diamino-6-(ribosylamino)-4(3H)-pyrimidinone 5'-phosphate reductase